MIGKATRQLKPNENPSLLVVGNLEQTDFILFFFRSMAKQADARDFNKQNCHSLTDNYRSKNRATLSKDKDGMQANSSNTVVNEELSEDN